MIFTLNVTVFFVFLMLVPGILARRNGLLTADSTAQLSQIIIKYIYPALIFNSIYRNYGIAALQKDWILPFLGFGIMLLGFILSLLVSKFISFKDTNEKKSFLFQGTLNNYSFLPLPIVMTLMGNSGVAALILSALGGEIAVWTLGITIMSSEKIGKENFKHLLSPPLIAIYTALFLRFTTDKLGLTGDILDPHKFFIATRFLETLKIFGAATVPLAFLISGSRIAVMKGFNIRQKNVIIITFLRMVIIPIAFLTLLSFFNIPKDVLFIITIVAVMPCALASFIFSELYGGDKELITTTVILTHLISFISVPILLNIYLPTL